MRRRRTRPLLIPILQTLDRSMLDPRWRLRAFNQAAIDPTNHVDNPRFEMEKIYAISRSAAPNHPLLLDLRLKRLLAKQGTTLDLDEIEAMLRDLKKASGRSRSNAHVIEAALAVQLGDTRRARAALEVARSLVRSEANEVDRANLANIESLERQLGVLHD